MIILGLTGSVGMGKSTAANLFREFDIPVHDADAATHALLDVNGGAVAKIETLFPTTAEIDDDGNKYISRQKLGQIVFNDDVSLKKIEAILHPLVRAKTDDFVKEQADKGSDLVVLDIPLLYETKGEDRCDAVLVVYTSDLIQRKRVLARPNMTVERLEAILEKQMPATEKLKRADFSLSMEDGIDEAKARIKAMMPQFMAITPTINI